jgi:hypothetical protein
VIPFLCLFQASIHGGWGIRNLTYFNQALMENTLWKVLMQGGIWNRVVKDKYISNCSIFNWFRMENQKKNVASRIWSSLIRTVHFITHWLAWWPGSGHKIDIGRDHILDIKENSILSSETLSVLKQKNFSIPSQVSEGRDPLTNIELWLSRNRLGFKGTRAIEWEQYTRELKVVGISLKNNQDDLGWTGGDSSRNISVKNLYDAIISTKQFPSSLGWKTKIWKWKLQLKIKIFIWLEASNRILTWAVLKKKGWEGPDICSLCR